MLTITFKIDPATFGPEGILRISSYLEDWKNVNFQDLSKEIENIIKEEIIEFGRRKCLNQKLKLSKK